jgi:hypothetical protein
LKEGRRRADFVGRYAAGTTCYLTRYNKADWRAAEARKKPEQPCHRAFADRSGRRFGMRRNSLTPRWQPDTVIKSDRVPK